MTIGKKFLNRVLSEGQLNEAAKDVDGFKDDFDITTLSATSPVVANLPLPLARQVVQLYHLMGVSVETLEMRPKAVRQAAMEVADEMRTNRGLRRAAQRLFSALATAKGFARKEEEVMEANASMAPEKDLMLVGSTIVKQMEAVLAALKLPAGVLQRAMRRDQPSLMETAEILRSGAGRSKFAMLASELGVDLMGVGRSVKVQEAAPVAAVEGPELGQTRAAQAMETLIGALGLEKVFNTREALATRRALPEKMANLRNPTAVYTLIDRLVKELGNTK